MTHNICNDLEGDKLLIMELFSSNESRTQDGTLLSPTPPVPTNSPLPRFSPSIMVEKNNSHLELLECVKVCIRQDLEKERR